MEKITTGNIIHWALWDAFNLTVAVEKQACAPRCIGSTDNTSEARQIIEAYEHGDQLNIPPKRLMESYRRMIMITKALQTGKVGGV